MGWHGPVLTDSGGYQIFSLPADRTVDEEGARFRSYIDSRIHLLSPESSIDMQTAIGSDIMMVLDECIDSTAPRRADPRGHGAHPPLGAAQPGGAHRPAQALFAIVQGGLDPALRAESAGFLTEHPFDGFAIGGLAVGDTRAERDEVIGARGRPPAGGERPRYLMGVGTPPDLLEAIGLRRRHVRLRAARRTLAWQGTAFTSTGRVRVTRCEHTRLSERRRSTRAAPARPAGPSVAGLPAPPLEVQRAARPAPALGAQPRTTTWS